MSNRFLGGIVSAKPQTTSAFTSRASTGTYFNNLGQLVTAPINQPRLNYSFNGNPISTRYSLFSNSSGYLSTTSASAFAFGASNFTIEYWSWQSAVSDERRSIYSYNSAQQFLVGHSSNTVFFAAYNGSGTLIAQPTTGAGTLIAGQWNHIAVVRNGTTVTIYINGVSQASSSAFGATAIRTDQTNLYVGQDPVTAGRTFNGYLSNVRIVNGVAVYTGNFTVPTAPLTSTQSSGTNISAISGTSTTLLTCQNNSFTDFSPSPLTITNNGGVPSTFVPLIYPSDFSGTGWGNPSVLIEPSSTNLNTYSSALTGWTLNGVTSISTNNIAPDGSSTAIAFSDGTTSGYKDIELNFALNPTTYTFSAFVKSSIPYFILAVNFNGTTPYVNVVFNMAAGTIYSTSSSSTSSPYASAPWGNISNVGNGWYRLSMSFTVLTQISGAVNTHRIGPSLDGTNTQYGGSSYQGASRSFYVWGVQLEQTYGATSYIPTSGSTVTRSQDDVGPGQASGMYRLAEVQAQSSIDDQNTVQSYTLPYGAYFNSTNSYINYSQGSTLTFGTNNFTVECWIYLTASQYAQYIVDARDSTHQNNWAFGWGLSTLSQLTWYNGTSYVTADPSTTDAGTNKWNHIAYVRNGTTGTIYLNGVSVGSGTDSTNYTVTSSTTTIGSRYNYPIYNMTGYMTNLRIVNGVAVYTGTFLPPTSPLTTTQSAGTNISAITGTSTVLLTFQSSSIVDASNNAFSLTNNNVTPAGVTAFGSTYYWTAPADVTSAEVLVVGGGGGGGYSGGGGGGAGGVVYNPSYPVTPGTTYPIVIGTGGLGAVTSARINGSNGNTSSFGTITASGGGGGATYYSASDLVPGSGGASGGGGAGNGGGSQPGGPGTAGQGYPGGASQSGSPFSAGGGGGAGGSGIPGANSIGGAGGPGLQFNISGTPTFYGGGGGGGGINAGASAGAGGIGGGGTGATYNVSNGFSGTAATGGGGGGGGNNNLGTLSYGGPGGSGIVLVKYKRTNSKLTTISNEGVVMQKFSVSNNWTAPAGVTQVEVLTVGGGGGGAATDPSPGGGGGAGGVVYNSAYTVTPGTTYSVIVGNGGTAGATGNTAASFGGTGSGSLLGANNLVSNGTFTNGITGWTDPASGAEGTFVAANGALYITNSNTTDPPACLYQAITCIVGHTYMVTTSKIGGVNDLFVTNITTGVSTGGGSGGFGNVLYFPNSGAQGTLTGMFTAAQTSYYIFLRLNTNGICTSVVTNIGVFDITAGTSVIAYGGGGGARDNQSAIAGTYGSGGGGSLTGTGAAGTAGQGYAGGAGALVGSPVSQASGGGGGAGSAGGNGISGTTASSGTGGNGGAGLPFSITGNLEYYGGGGGGSGFTTYGVGGIGGGGSGSYSAAGNNGSPNTGGGGGGGGGPNNTSYYIGGTGGSGVVIIRYRVPTYAVFQDSGSWTCPAGVTSVQALIVAGGGSGSVGGGGGGGGAGGLVYSSSISVTPGVTYPIVVGAGGAGVTGGPDINGTAGQNSSFNGLVAIGGGQGAHNGYSGQTGGSGGGAYGSGNAGSGTYGQGNSGGGGVTDSSTYTNGGGGGGAGGAGSAAIATQGGAGGIGLAFSITGTSVYYAGGGAGGVQKSGGTSQVGGLGGGGNNSGAPNSNGLPGAQNTGGGGGGASYSSASVASGSGGSGIVIIRWYGG